FHKVLAKEPKERYASAGELASAFTDVVTALTPLPNGETVEPQPLSAVAAGVAAGKHSEEVTQEVRDIIRQRLASERTQRLIRRLPLTIGGIIVLVLVVGLVYALSEAAQTRVAGGQTGTAIVALQNQASTLQAALASGTAPGQEETLSAAFTQLAVQGIALSATSTFTPSSTPTRTPIPTDPPTATATVRPTNTFVPTFTFTPTTVPISFAPGTVPTAVPGDAGIVSGEVYFLNGPVAGATVTLRQASTGALYGTATTDAGGQFAFQGVGPDSWVINATTPDGLTSMFYGTVPGGQCDYFAGRANTSRTVATLKQQTTFAHICVVRIGGFEITAPALGGVFPGLIISWTPLEGATNYDISVHDITDPFKPPLAEDFLTQTTFDYTKKLGGDPTISRHCYLIRIVAHSGSRGPIAVNTTEACRQ
ncbi:MAG TPA: carboxypeptidase-like regulatory domain-containing protein, partial [Anaerolineales bacterium]|nr:carboxypeptidase-like regulatory domain-containing protein [Anaerolineales bacterium]